VAAVLTLAEREAFVLDDGMNGPLVAPSAAVTARDEGAVFFPAFLIDLSRYSVPSLRSAALDKYDGCWFGERLV
jgi:hypothetical protein